LLNCTKTKNLATADAAVKGNIYGICSLPDLSEDFLQ